MDPPFTAPRNLKVWPGAAPATQPVGMGTTQPAMKSETLEVRTDSAGKYQWVMNVSVPTLRVFLPARKKATGAAVVICPGGGYQGLAIDKEGYELAKWFVDRGVAGIVLKYRVPNNRDGAFADVQRAMRVVRLHAKDWNIHSDQVGVMGFSAGAHLAARLSDNWRTASYAAVDSADELSMQPNFALLIYMGGGIVDRETNQLDPRTLPNGQTPATFMVQAYDDPVHVENSLVYFSALKAAGVKRCEMHIYVSGGHGYGMRPVKSSRFIDTWPTQMEQWLKEIGVLR